MELMRPRLGLRLDMVHSQHSCSSSANSRHQVENYPLILGYFCIKISRGPSQHQHTAFSETFQPENRTFYQYSWRSHDLEVMCLRRQLVWFGEQVIGLVFLYISQGGASSSELGESSYHDIPVIKRQSGQICIHQLFPPFVR